MLKDFFRDAPRNFMRMFTGSNLLWHAAAIALTAVLVLSGADWQFFLTTRSDTFYWLVFGAGIGGFFVSVVVPVGMYWYGEFRADRRIMDVGAAVGRAALLGYLVSVVYKIFTGRIQPEFLTNIVNTDITRQFHFGILQNGVFWGWPSSHAATAFAGATALVLLVPNKSVRIAAALYACFIGVGAAIGFHWLSDVIAGALFGILAGVVVAKDVAARIKRHS